MWRTCGVQGKTMLCFQCFPRLKYSVGMQQCAIARFRGFVEGLHVVVEYNVIVVQNCHIAAVGMCKTKIDGSGAIAVVQRQIADFLL